MFSICKARYVDPDSLKRGTVDGAATRGPVSLLYSVVYAGGMLQEVQIYPCAAIAFDEVSERMKGASVVMTGEAKVYCARDLDYQGMMASIHEDFAGIPIEHWGQLVGMVHVCFGFEAQDAGDRWTPALNGDPHLERAGQLLRMSLEAAVPFLIEDLKRLPWEEVSRLAHESAQVVAEKGDILLYGGSKKGETARAFNALARGVAALSFVPGGVTVFGLHFEAKHEG